MNTTWDDLPYASDFPNEECKSLIKQDLTSDSLPIINQYNNYLAMGDANGLMMSKQYMLENPIIKEHVILASDILALSQELVAIERTFIRDIEKYIMSVVEFRGEYDDTESYVRYNIVLYKEQAYFCYKDAEIGILPTDTNYFYPITLEGKQGNPGVDFVPMGEWNKDFTYSANHAVSWKGSLWYSISDFNSGNEPSDLSIHWKKFLILSQKASDLYMNSGITVENKINGLEANVNTELSFLNQTVDLLTEKTTLLYGEGAPSLNTIGKVGQYYKDISSGGRLYVCDSVFEVVSSEGITTQYKWAKLIRETDSFEPTCIWKYATSTGTSGYDDINAIDHRYFVVDVGDNNILKYFDNVSSTWKPIVSVWN